MSKILISVSPVDESGKQSDNSAAILRHRADDQEQGALRGCRSEPLPFCSISRKHLVMTNDRAIFLECARGLRALGERMRVSEGVRV